MKDVSRILWTVAAIVVVGGAIFGRNPHPHVWWEAIPAYGAIFGYAGTYALALFAKKLLAPRIRRE